MTIKAVYVKLIFYAMLDSGIGIFDTPVTSSVVKANYNYLLSTKNLSE